MHYYIINRRKKIFEIYKNYQFIEIHQKYSILKFSDTSDHEFVIFNDDTSDICRQKALYNIYILSSEDGVTKTLKKFQ